MTIYETIKDYLKIQPLARERRNHARAMINILLKKYKDTPELKAIPKTTLIDFCRDFDSYIREWREVQRLEKDLRGKDFEDGRRLAQEVQLKRGYEPNYYQDILKLRTL